MCYVHNQWYDISCATLYVIIIAFIATNVSQSASTLPLYVQLLSCLLTELHMTKSEALFYVC